MEQTGQVVQVHAAPFVQGDEQGFLREIDDCQWPLLLNGPFPEDGGLGRAPGFLVVVLQGQQQRLVGIAPEGARIGALGNRSKPADKIVVRLIEHFP